MMHTEYTVLMSAVLDHEAPPGDVQRLHEHLASCPACAQTWSRWRSLDAFLVAAPFMAPPSGFELRVAARLEERRRQQRRRRWLGSGLLLAWAVSMVVTWLVLAGVLLWGYTHPQAVSQVAAGGAQTLSSLASFLRALREAIRGLGVLPLSLGLGFYLGLTALVSAGWLWLMARKSAWAEALSQVRDVSASS